MSTFPRPEWAKTLSDFDYELTERGHFTVHAAAAYTGTSDKWIYGLIKEAKLSSVRVGKRLIIQKLDLDALLSPGAS